MAKKPEPKKSTALATRKPSTGLATKASSLPAHLRSGKGRGNSALSAKDMSMPFLRIAQDGTPQVEAGQAEAGNFINSLTSEVYGETVDITIVHAMVGQMRFGDYNSDEGILCRSDDGVTASQPNGEDEKGKPTASCLSCVHKDWGKDARTGKDIPPICDRHAKYFVLVGENMDTAILDLTRTSFPAARKINTMLSQLAGQGADAFARKFTLSGKLVTAKKSYYTIEASQGAYLTADEFKKAENVYESMKSSFTARSRANEATSTDLNI